MIRPLRVWHRRLFVMMLALPPLLLVALAQRPDPAFWRRVDTPSVVNGVQARWRDASQFELTAQPPLRAADPLVYVVGADGVLHFVGSFDGRHGVYASPAFGELRIVSGVDRRMLAVVPP